jgi:hypothetical protein
MLSFSGDSTMRWSYELTLLCIVTGGLILFAFASFLIAKRVYKIV